MARWTEIDVDVQRDWADSKSSYWALELDTMELWAWQDAFTPDECDAIIELGERESLRRGITRGGDSNDRRRSDVGFLYPSPLSNWVFARLASAALSLNSQFFGFDLGGFGEGLQFTRYTAPGEHYGWHVDSGMGIAQRKLSLVVQLSDPADHNGGDLDLMVGGEPTAMDRSRGRLIAFPSWTVHRVTPVNEGTRYSLVAWVTGPPFR